MSVSFIVWRNRNTRRKPSSCGKSLKICIIYSFVEYTLPWAGFKLIMLVGIGSGCTCSGNPTTKRSRQQRHLGPYWRTYDVKCLPNRVLGLVCKRTCHNKTWTSEENICLSYLITLRKSKSKRAISLSQNIWCIQTAINPFNFILLFTSGEWNTVLWTGHFTYNYSNHF
jgi:hypothetical protein